MTVINFQVNHYCSYIFHQKIIALCYDSYNAWGRLYVFPSSLPLSLSQVTCIFLRGQHFAVCNSKIKKDIRSKLNWYSFFFFEAQWYYYSFTCPLCLMLESLSYGSGAASIFNYWCRGFLVVLVQLY